MADLREVRPADRLRKLRQAVPSLFPGMTLDHCVHVPNRGLVQHTQLANSHAWLIDSCPVSVAHFPDGLDPAKVSYISLMLQMQGSTQVSQQTRCYTLTAGQFCLIDNLRSFVLKVPKHYSRFLVWQLPREHVLKYHPHIDKLSACSYDTGNPVASMVSKNIVQTLEVSAYLTEHQQAVALNSVIQLLGILELPGSEQPDNKTSKHLHWRIMRALEAIEKQLANPTLNAHTVADEQGISRRQLDRMFQDETGVTVTARIWGRRLGHAAELLKHPSHALRSIADIALASGFEDAAHFTRSFKKCYKLTPREWRYRARQKEGEIIPPPGILY